MARQMSPEREREYVELFAYLDFFATNVRGIDPVNPIHPTNVGKRIVAKYGRSKALDGLKQAANDTVEYLRDEPHEYIQRLDATLRNSGIVTFSDIRRRYASSYKRILKRGKIREETEYYVIVGVLADSPSRADPQEQQHLSQLVADYENSVQSFGREGASSKLTTPKAPNALKDGDHCSVIGGTHNGKSGTVRDINTSKTGHVTITVVQANGERFKTLAKNVVVQSNGQT
jgi:hypothetical protein